MHHNNKQVFLAVIVIIGSDFAVPLFPLGVALLDPSRLLLPFQSLACYHPGASGKRTFHIIVTLCRLAAFVSLMCHRHVQSDTRGGE
jgi:hypothetical protein